MSKKLLRFVTLLLVVVFCVANVVILRAGGKKKEAVPEVPEAEVPVEEVWSLEKAAAPYKGKTIKAIFEDWAAMRAEEGVVKKFEEITGIKVDVVWGDNPERRAKTSSDMIAGTHIYTFGTMGWNEIGYSVENGWVEPIDKFFSDPKLHDPSFDPYKVYPKAFTKACQWDGVNIGFVNYHNTPFLIYRKDIATNEEERIAFKKRYGYDFPISPGNYFPIENFKQYRDICEFFTRKKGQKLAGKTLKENFYGTTIAFKQSFPAMCFLEHFIAEFGTFYYDDKGKPALNSPEMVKALEYYATLRPYAYPGYLEFGYDETYTAYSTGHVFIYFSWPDTFSYIENPEYSKVAGLNDYCLPPIVKGSNGWHSVLNITDWVIWKGAPNQEAAYLLIQYIGSYESQLEVQRANGCTGDPRVIALPEIQEKFPWFKCTNALFKNGRIFAPKGYPWVTYAIDICSMGLNKVGIDRAFPKEALDEAQEKIVKEYK